MDIICTFRKSFNDPERNYELRDWDFWMRNGMKGLSWSLWVSRPPSITHYPGTQHFLTRFHSAHSTMKRKATDSTAFSKPKKAKEAEPNYCDVEPKHAGDGCILWPASTDSINLAREFIQEWLDESQGK